MTKKLMCFTSVALLAAWLGAPETRASSWTNLGSGLAGGGVLGLAFNTNGNLYAGGDFTTTGGNAATNVARWNGSSWTNLGSGMNDRIWSLAYDTNGNLYAGGSFTTAGGSAATNVAQWNESTGSWTNLNSGMNATVRSLACGTNGNLYAGGDFTNAGGMAANRISQWNASTGWTNLGSGMNDRIWSLAYDTNGNLYAGGDFTTAGGRAATNVAQWNGSSWTNLGSGMNNRILSLVCDTNGNLYAGGDFTTADGRAANYIAKWNASTGWTNLNSGMDGSVYALAFDPNGNLYAGGSFTTAGGRAATNVAQWNGSSWTNLGSGMNNMILSLACNTNGNLYAGGFFTTAGGVAATNIAKWTEWTEGRIGIVPTTLIYTATNGVGNPAAQTFVVTNAGQAAFTFTNTVSYGAGASNWFMPAPPTGQVSAAGPLTVTGNVDITGLNVGTYYATNTFTATNAANSPQTLVVMLRVLNGREGRIGIVPASLTYIATNGAGNPAAQPFVVNNSGLTAFTFTNTVSYGAGASNWFFSSVTTGTVSADGSLSVTGSVNIINLNDGTYYATNTITTTNADNSPQTLVVTLHVLGKGLIGIVPDSLTYNATTNDIGDLAMQTFMVTNAGQVTFTFTNTVSYSAGASNWFLPSAMTGLVVTNGWLPVTGRVTIVTNLPAGTYYATNTFTATNTANSPLMVVTLHVFNPSQRLWLSPPNEKVVTEGQGTVWDTMHIANTGTVPRGVITYALTATSGPPAWLSVSPTNGSVQDNTNDVAIEYTTAAPGWHTGQVYATTAGDLGDQSVDIKLRVNHRPGVAWNAGNKTWTNEIMAGDSIGSTTVEIWNASGTPAGQMNYTVSVLDDPDGWVSFSPTNGVSTGDHRMVTVSYPNTAGLVAGYYTAKLKVAGVDAATGIATTNGPLIMGLKLTVKGTPALKVSVTNLSQTLLENLSGTSWFSIDNEGRLPHGNMSYTVTVDADGWASVSPTHGVVTTGATEIQVLWDAGVLSPGVYTGNLVVSAAGTNLVIPMTLTVTSRTPLNMELPTVAGTMYIGQTVEANVGLWKNQARLTFGYQWERASNKAGGGGEVLSGAVGANYVITTADRGKYLRVDVTATDLLPFPKSSMTNSAWVDAAKVKALQADFNGDGITDLWFYNMLSGVWHASFGTTDSADGIFPGGPDMIAMPGDYDGDGYEDLGVYEYAHGMWHIYYLPRGDYVYGSLFGGTAEEAAATPVVADFDGDGATDVGLYYMGYWGILYSSLGSVSVLDPFANAWGEPVSGDWDGDGITEMGVYDDGVWTLRMGNGSLVEQEFGGGSGVLPVPGDYDADGTTDLGVYDVGANQWRWRESRTGFEQSLSFGSGGTEARPGYYDHDRSNDWAQVHMSADNDIIVWEVKRTTETNFPYRGQSYQQSTDRWRVSW